MDLGTASKQCLNIGTNFPDTGTASHLCPMNGPVASNCCVQRCPFSGGSGFESGYGSHDTDFRLAGICQHRGQIG